MASGVLSAAFIDRPRLAIVIALLIIIAGTLALLVIPVSQFPDILPPRISVSARYPGASAGVVETVAAQLIEGQVSGVGGMLYMSSNSADDGSYDLDIGFELGTDPDIALVSVSTPELAQPELPARVSRCCEFNAVRGHPRCLTRRQRAGREGAVPEFG